MTSDAAPEHPLKISMIGGGSGGHLFPAIAVAHSILREHPDARIQFLVSHRAIDLKILQSAGWPNSQIDVYPYVKLPQRDGSIGRLLMVSEMWRSFRQAKRLLTVFSPNVAIGVGAMASVPGVIAASRLSVPIALMEQNTLPGKANRTLARRAKLILAGLPFDERYSDDWPCEISVTGTPVREQISSLFNRDPSSLNERPRLLILGGSQGSRSVNRLVLEALSDEHCVPSDWQIVHQTGQSQVEEVSAEYARHGRTATVLSFLPDLPQQLKVATVVISRAGAGTLQELACAGLPSILIPFSKSANDHQRLNAMCFQAADSAALVLETDDDAGTQLREVLNTLVAQPELRQRYSTNIRTFARPEAASKSAEIIRNLAVSAR